MNHDFTAHLESLFRPVSQWLANGYDSAYQWIDWRLRSSESGILQVVDTGYQGSRIKDQGLRIKN